MRALNDLLAELDKLNDDRLLDVWLERHLTLANANAVLARVPHALVGANWYRHTPVCDLVRSGGGPVNQWEARYRQQTFVTLFSGARAPAAWAAGPIHELLESTSSWDRLWACSEVLRLQLDDTATRAQTVSLLRDAYSDVRSWAWLCVVRWAELEPVALVETIDPLLDGECAELRPVAVWAALTAGSKRELAPLLACALKTTAAIDALTVATWLGQAAAPLAAAVESLLDAEDDDVVRDAVGALAQIAPHRWPRLLECAQERRMFTPRQRRGEPPRGPTMVPTARAGACLTALEGLAPTIDDDGVRAIVALANDEHFASVVGALGTRGRGAIPALAQQLAASGDNARSPLYAALAQLGAVEVLEAAIRREPTAAYALPRLGKAAGPAIHRLLVAGLDDRATRFVLDAIEIDLVDDAVTAAVVAHLDAPHMFVRLAACAALARLSCNDEILLRLVSVFVACCANEDPFFCRAYAEASAALSPLLVERMTTSSDLLKVRWLEAIGWAGEAAQPHLALLEELSKAKKPVSAAAKAAIERILHPPPRYRPNT